jgi:catechol 2,3-dioxygenase-like lactoylglutathione lyase family enzyme
MSGAEPPLQGRFAEAGEPIHPALHPLEPAVDVSAHDPACRGRRRPELTHPARTRLEQRGAGERLLPVGGHDRLACIGFHHYAFQLRSRRDVDALQSFLEKLGATIVDPAGEYYDDYYAVFFLDPDGLKLEGMKYGERQEQSSGEEARSKNS